MIGFVGLGDMGLPMASRLLAEGHEVIAWNRSPGPLSALEEKGAVAAADPAEVMSRAELVGLCLSSHETVETVAFGPRGLFSATDIAARAVADFSTGSAEAARSFANRAEEKGVAWVDAPVSGGVPAAESGELIVFAGGTAEGARMLAPLFEAVAERVTHVGPSGAGQVMKICNQMIAATNVVAIAEATAFARKAGVEVDTLASALAGGFADSAPLRIFGPRMAAQSFSPRLGAISLMRKDTGLVQALAAEIGAEVPLTDAARRVYDRAGDHPDIDFDSDLSALVRLYEDALTHADEDAGA
ncbi:NAD(P)-dependent oxidoreductase [Tropicimonas sp. IMCC34011]|uniref:NAD(P)-dependent oxidoreductase n=1 Tax=Tropicimonas sp. IMCC34011 TaxID=2248759 RepID=UPI000E2289A8|nr:NAD(P)-dependent oxidoreductase [Tropicimonas sp. IMCC34011]